MRRLHSICQLLPFVVMALAPQFVGGCVAWHSSNARPVSDKDFFRVFDGKTGMAPVKVLVDVESDSSISGQETKKSRRVERSLTRLFQKALKRADWARFVETPNPDYVLFTRLTTQVHPSHWSLVLFCLTASVFPWMPSTDMVFDVEISTVDGELIGKRHIETTRTIMVELFMVFGMPFALPTEVGRDVVLDVFKDIFTWAKETILTHRAQHKPRSDPQPKEKKSGGWFKRAIGG